MNLKSVQFSITGQDDQVAAAIEIVKLSATDIPMEIVSRLIYTFNKVISRKGKLKESLGTFVC
jgi:hypothetical protein